MNGGTNMLNMKKVGKHGTLRNQGKKGREWLRDSSAGTASWISIRGAE